MTVGKGKRPPDPNQLAKWIVDRSAGEIPTSQQEPAGISSGANISAYMAVIGRKGGQIGGKRRMKTMTKAERQRIAANAARARWKKSRGQ